MAVNTGARMKKHVDEVPLGPRRPFPFGVDKTGMVRKEVASEIVVGRGVEVWMDLMKLPYEEGSIKLSSSLNGASRDDRLVCS